MKSVNEIIQLLKKNKPYLKTNYGVISISIFGSYSRNEANKQSDIDIMVDFEKTPGLEFVDLAEELEDILGTKVDLVSKKGVKNKYFKQIEQDVVHV